LTITAFEIADSMDPDVADGLRGINATLERLSRRRLDRITVSGPFERSKLAWKVATYSQAVLYRVVMLASGCALTWNHGNALCSILAGRALVETVATLIDFDKQLAKLLDQEDLAGIDTAIMKLSFATRDEEMLKENPEVEAVNTLTFIGKLDRKHGLEGAFQHYISLSELCHPNHGGHLGLFGMLDRETGETTYSDAKARS
jgi:hypothetical protein